MARVAVIACLEFMQNRCRRQNRGIHIHIDKENSDVVLKIGAVFLDDCRVNRIAFFLKELKTMCVVIYDAVESITDTLNGVL